MARRARTVPQPPLVWGPSEINEWIRGAYPSEGRTAPRPRKRAVQVVGLTAKIWTDSVRPVRERFEGIITALGFAAETRSDSEIVAVKAGRRIRSRFRRSIVSDSVSVVLHFEPPVHLSTAKKIVRGFGDAFSLAKVSLRKA